MPEDGRVASRGYDGTVWIWDPAKPVWDHVGFWGPSSWGCILAALPGGRIVAADWEILRGWSVASRKAVHRFVADSFVECIAITPTNVIVAGCHDGGVHFLRPRAGR